MMAKINLTNDQMADFVDNFNSDDLREDECILNCISDHAINIHDINLIAKLLNMDKLPHYILVDILSNSSLCYVLDIILLNFDICLKIRDRINSNFELLDEILFSSQNEISTIKIIIKYIIIDINNTHIEFIFRSAIYNNDLDMIAVLAENNFDVKSAFDKLISEIDTPWYRIKFGTFIFLEKYEINLSEHIDIIGSSTVYRNDLVGIKYCFENGADINSLLMIAIIKCHNANIIKYLLQNGANISTIKLEDILSIIWNHTNTTLDIITLLVDCGLDISSNLNKLATGATICGLLDLLKYFIRLGADIHTDNDLLLIYATGFRHMNIVIFLLDCGVNICAPDNLVLNFFELDRKKITRSIFGKYKMSSNSDNLLCLPMFKFLIKNGAMLADALDMFLSYAIDRDYPVDEELFLYFLDHGLDVNANVGDSLLEIAIDYRKTNIAKLLLKYGADPHINNNYSFELAIENKDADVELVEILLRMGCKTDVKPDQIIDPRIAELLVQYNFF